MGEQLSPYEIGEITGNFNQDLLLVVDSAVTDSASESETAPDAILTEEQQNLLDKREAYKEISVVLAAMAQHLESTPLFIGSAVDSEKVLDKFVIFETLLQALKTATANMSEDDAQQVVDAYGAWSEGDALDEYLIIGDKLTNELSGVMGDSKRQMLYIAGRGIGTAARAFASYWLMIRQNTPDPEAFYELASQKKSMQTLKTLIRAWHIDELTEKLIDLGGERYPNYPTQALKSEYFRFDIDGVSLTRSFVEDFRSDYASERGVCPAGHKVQVEGDHGPVSIFPVEEMARLLLEKAQAYELQEDAV